VLGTAGLPMGRLELESIVRAERVVITDPVVAASGPPATLAELDDLVRPPRCRPARRDHRLGSRPTRVTARRCGPGCTVGRQRLGLIVIAHASAGLAVVTAGEGAVAVSFPLTTPTQLRLAS
jgi:hypothetical protein